MKTPALLVFAAALGLSSGCVVPQPRGEGLYKRVTEPRTGGVYHLYLPVDYVRNNGSHPNYPKVRRWPLVMTFHGMKPYDNAVPQEREWEKEADFYGYIVCAPELATSNSFMDYPLTSDQHGYVQEDIRNVLAIMDHVFATTLADRERVLSTSWSCGGYLAHYFPNRYPNRFSCIATRLSNFSAELLREDTVRLYRKMPVALFIGDGDFPKCKSESQQAVAWYTARNFEVVRGKMIDHMGHRRIPQTAAAFFAEQLGIVPLHPIEAAQTVAQVQMTEYYPPRELIAQMSPKGTAPRWALGPPRPTPDDQVSDRENTTPTRSRLTHDPIIHYVSTSAGLGYPFDRQPEHSLQPEPLSGEPDNSKSPPTAAESTAVATAHRSADKPLPAEARSHPPQARSVKKTPETAAPPTRDEPRAFEPEDAGSKDHSPWLASNLPGDRRQPPSADNSKTPNKPRRQNPSQRKPGPREAPATKTTPTPKASTPVRTANGVAHRVIINIEDPPVGSAPFCLSYAADLPPDVLRGADFLWKDNGVWMDDEPQGAKLLDSPGSHKITVLLITLDNVAYRGMATVRVLDAAAPTLSAGRPQQP